MTLEAVFLDIGNTLVYEVPSRYAIYAEVARRHGIEVDEQAMRGLMAAAHRELPDWVEGAFRYTDPWFEKFIEIIFHRELKLPSTNVAGVAAELFDRFEDARTFRLFPGTIELLEELRTRGLRLGIISNWSARLPRLLDALDLTPRFDVVICSAIVGVEKPHPAIFERALEEIRVPPEAALHAGDDPRTDGGALQQGMHFVLVDHHGRHPESSHPRVEDLAALGRRIAAHLS